MARREVTQFFDDIDHTPINEDELEVIRFSVNGKNYLLDLSRENARAFHEMMTPYIEAARIAPDRDNRRVDPSKVRAWAREQGIPVAHRGKIPHSVIDAYNEAHAV
ncbi:Lsr2 family protein [Corynebacterium sp.]|uniref:histone-like nucleoid-structuring protein Lsr2 n=1 Tax=Corynebacterium sp. TaxID=1720 RepID=UPI0026DCB5B7|nr:Lsr2 family protein [Corynebacterium sp.]MDO5032953.1 Lsr2 family protein [Corynebacterium sp.]